MRAAKILSKVSKLGDSSEGAAAGGELATPDMPTASPGFGGLGHDAPLPPAPTATDE
jgi:hypothetical protein